MKALKEKRIRLRSLWRRGLVILSLFALVFAGCSDSGSDGGGGGVQTSLKTIVGVAKLADPTASGETQYEGFPVDLTGLKVLVRYNDNSTQEITDTSKFYLESPYYLAGVTNYNVYLENTGQLGNSVGSVKCAKEVKAVAEVHWHGALNSATYFSDDIPDFSGLSLEMRYYVDGHEGLYHKTLELPKEWRNWRFSERKEDNQPFVKITFSIADAVIPLDKIYYVDTLTFDPEPAFLDSAANPIFVDALISGSTMSSVFTGKSSDPSTIKDNLNYFAYQNAWIDRLGDTKLKVTYTDTTESRTYTVAELKTMRQYYTNQRPGYSSGLWNNMNPQLMVYDAPFYDDADTANSKTDNYVNNKKGCTITFAYRGVKMEPYDVPVYGQFVSVAAESKTGEDVEYNLNPYINWPDPTDPRDDLTSLAAKFDVIATYGLYTDKGTTTTKKIPFNKGWTQSSDLPGTDGTDAVEWNGTSYVSAYEQGKYYEIRSNFLDQYAAAIASGKDKTYKLTINYTPGLLFSGLPKTAKLSVNFINVAGGGPYVDF